MTEVASTPIAREKQQLEIALAQLDEARRMNAILQIMVTAMLWRDESELGRDIANHLLKQLEEV